MPVADVIGPLAPFLVYVMLNTVPPLTSASSLPLVWRRTVMENGLKRRPAADRSRIATGSSECSSSRRCHSSQCASMRRCRTRFSSCCSFYPKARTLNFLTIKRRQARDLFSHCSGRSLVAPSRPYAIPLRPRRCTSRSKSCATPAPARQPIARCNSKRRGRCSQIPRNISQLRMIAH